MEGGPGAHRLPAPPRGPTQLSASTTPLAPATYQGSVHPMHNAMEWSVGSTQPGSSGAPLLDASPGGGARVVGVLTGGTPGTTPAGCPGASGSGPSSMARNASTSPSSSNTYFFGSLYTAWELGLWQHLSPAGPDAVTRMDGRRAAGQPPALVVNPTQLELPDTSTLAAPLLVRLSLPPAAGEVLAVAVSVQLTTSENDTSLVTTDVASLTFAAGSWDQWQRVLVIPGAEGLLQGPLAFEVVLQLSSTSSPGVVLEDLWIPGVQPDAQMPTGASPAQPFLVVLDGASSYCHQATLAAGQESHYYNLTTALPLGLSVGACTNSSSNSSSSSRQLKVEVLQQAGPRPRLQGVGLGVRRQRTALSAQGGSRPAGAAGWTALQRHRRWSSVAQPATTSSAPQPSPCLLGWPLTSDWQGMRPPPAELQQRWLLERRTSSRQSSLPSATCRGRCPRQQL